MQLAQRSVERPSDPSQSLHPWRRLRGPRLSAETQQLGQPAVLSFRNSPTPPHSPPPAAMKFTLALAAAAVATVAAYDHTTTCPFTSFTKLAPLVEEASLFVCQDASGWQMLPPVGMPTADQYALMCATPECFQLITAVNATQPDDCMLVFGDVSLNVKELVDTFEPICFA